MTVEAKSDSYEYDFHAGHTWGGGVVGGAHATWAGVDATGNSVR
jgi:hypothetical protein